MTLTSTQQELNVRFAKALGWKLKRCEHHKTNTWHSPEGICADGNCEAVLPNYFTPENFHLVRAAVSELTAEHNFKFFDTLFPYLGFSGAGSGVYFVANAVFLSPVEHIIIAYLKVKEVN